MKATKTKNLFLIIGITAFLFGSLMKISHILYGIEVLMVGILMTGIGIFFSLSEKKELDLTNDHPLMNYPNILQSFGITGIVILGMLLFLPVNIALNDLIGKEASMLVYYLLAIGVSLVIVFLIRTSKTKLTSFNYSIDNKRIIPFIIIGSIALLFGIASPIGGLIPMSDTIKKALLELESQRGIFAFIIMVIAAPVMEEMIFRGIILDGLLRIYTPVKSILVSSILFGLVHLNPWQFVTGITLGIFSGWVYYKTRSLLPSIIIHAAANLSGFATRFMMDLESSMDKSVVETYGGWTNLIIAILGSIVILAICIYYLNREFIKTPIQDGGTQQTTVQAGNFSSLAGNY